MKDDALEKLAEAEHVQWCEWADVVSHELSSLLEIIERHEVKHFSQQIFKHEKTIINFSTFVQ